MDVYVQYASLFSNITNVFSPNYNAKAVFSHLSEDKEHFQMCQGWRCYDSICRAKGQMPNNVVELMTQTLYKHMANIALGLILYTI